MVSVFLGGVYGLGFLLDYNPIDKKAARNLIPRYPNTLSWRIYSGNGFPDGSPYASINFSTTDSGNQVSSFYKEELSKKGCQSKDIQNTGENRYDNDIFSGTCPFGGKIFSVNIQKDLNVSTIKKLESKKVTIFLSH